MTTTSDPIFVSQIALAKELRLSDRRIRQLVDERILPPPRDEGHDLELSRQRYQLYSRGSDRDWERCFDEAEDLARVARELNDRAYEDDATLEDVRAASLAIQNSTVMMAFLTAAKSKSRAERELFWGIWDREEAQVIAALLRRVAVLMGETHIRMDDGELIEIVPPAMAKAKSGRQSKPKPRGKAR